MRSKLNMSIGSLYYVTTYVTILEVFTVKMCMTVTFIMAKVNCKYANRKLLCDFIFDGIVMFAPSFTVCKIFTVEMCITLILTTRIGQGQIC